MMGWAQKTSFRSFLAAVASGLAVALCVHFLTASGVVAALARDLAAARNIAARLGIDHRVIDLAGAYKNVVLDYFREEYLAGRTPNPCVRCNQRMKFGFLLEQARAQGVAFDKFATGHYARTRYDAASGRWQLRRGKDAGKDQSYFLSRLRQEQLAGLIFPLGDLSKGEVKALARELG